jgi:hypothetical protein
MSRFDGKRRVNVQCAAQRRVKKRSELHKRKGRRAGRGCSQRPRYLVVNERNVDGELVDCGMDAGRGKEQRACLPRKVWGKERAKGTGQARWEQGQGCLIVSSNLVGRDKAFVICIAAPVFQVLRVLCKLLHSAL